jgi:hypothetical protein
LLVAGQTLGHTSQDWLSWLVGFTREDPSAWHSGDRAARADCLAYLAKPIPSTLVWAPAESLAGVIPPAEVDHLHTELRQLLQSAVTAPPRRPTMFAGESGGIALGLIRVSAVGTLPATWVPTYGAVTARDAVLYRTRELILEAGDKLLACPRCQRPFVKNGRQKFCDLKCGQAARNATKSQRPRRRRKVGPR